MLCESASVASEAYHLHMATNSIHKLSAAKTIASSEGTGANQADRSIAQPPFKNYKVIISSVKGDKTTVTVRSGGIYEAVKISGLGKAVKVDLSRDSLVGKYPQVKHLPAPKAKKKLDEKTRTSLLNSMVLG